MDQRRFALLEALKVAALHPGENRLYRRGKFLGLFAQHTSLNAEVAGAAVQDGLLEIVRVETVGKNDIEWVRITQKGLDFLLQAESPTRALEDLHAVLALNEQGLPAWVADMQNRLEQLTREFSVEVAQMRQQIEQLARRAAAAIDRIEQAREPAPVAWAQDALAILDGRKQVGLGQRCPLRDLFAALKEAHANLTLKEYHHGLKRLRESSLLTLLPDVEGGDAPGPEYALLDGETVYYYVGRGP